ncbi:MAG: peptide deformylase [Alphaproteobacteria bacterium]
MAILKIARMGHPVLTRSAAAVADPSAPEIRRLVADMIETMSDAEGLGLAAPQVHVAKRLVVFHTPHPGDEGEDEEDWSRLTVLVNPVVEAVGEAREDGWEGCLSVPGLRGLVSRYARVRYRGVTPDGEAIDRTVGGMHARIVQHECDHLDGILYPMRMTDLSKLVFESETRHYRGGAAEGTEGDA